MADIDLSIDNLEVENLELIPAGDDRESACGRDA